MAANKNCWLKLTHLAYFRAKGADNVNFLQGQLSSDVRRLSETKAQISSYNSPKGRMLAVLHLFRSGEDITLEIHRSISESVLKRLRMYVLRSKVVLDETDFAFGLMGPDAGEILTKLGLPQNGIQVIQRLGDLPRFSLHASPEKLSTLARQLAELLPQGNESDWKRADIEAGLPTVYPETQDRFVPQWCNLDQLGGISFDKGCYTGQEIVARIHYLGEVKRRMKLVHLTDCAGLSAGSQTGYGEIVDALGLPETGCVGLVVQKS
jgi:folate-binding protein YgfZ